MDMKQSVRWLAGASHGLLALDQEEVEYERLERYFSSNPQVLRVALAVATTFGIANEDPLVSGYQGVLFAREYHQHLDDPAYHQWEGTRCFMRTAWRGQQTVAVNAFLVAGAAAAAGLTLFELLAHGVDVASGVAASLQSITEPYKLAWSIGGAIGSAIGDHDFGEAASFLAEAGSVATDVLEGAATLGVGLAAAYGVKKAFEWINEEKSKQAEELGEKLQAKMQLRALVEGQAALPTVMHAMLDAQEHAVYRPVLVG